MNTNVARPPASCRRIPQSSPLRRPLVRLALLLLLMPALPATAQSTPARAARNAAPQAAVIAFADLCIMAPGPEAEDAAVRRRGGTPIKDTPPPGGRILRDVFLERPGDPFRMRLVLVDIDHPGAPWSMFLIRRFEPIGTLDAAGKALAPAGSAPNADAGEQAQPKSGKP